MPASVNLPTAIETQRLVVRAYRPEDAAAYHAMALDNKGHLRQYEAQNPVHAVFSAADAEKLLHDFAQAWQTRKAFFFGAFSKDTGRFTAQIYIGLVNPLLPEYELGYFAEHTQQGNGFVTEAAQATVGWAFTQLQAHRMSLRCDDTNHRSFHVAERCGFRREGHLRENQRKPDGSVTGTYLYGLLGHEYAG